MVMVMVVAAPSWRGPDEARRGHGPWLAGLPTLLPIKSVSGVTVNLPAHHFSSPRLAAPRSHTHPDQQHLHDSALASCAEDGGKTWGSTEDFQAEAEWGTGGGGVFGD